jgi:hypothetical protein
MKGGNSIFGFISAEKGTIAQPQIALTRFRILTQNPGGIGEDFPLNAKNKVC